jgi:hypothetical protein
MNSGSRASPLSTAPIVTQRGLTVLKSELVCAPPMILRISGTTRPCSQAFVKLRRLSRVKLDRFGSIYLGLMLGSQAQRSIGVGLSPNSMNFGRFWFSKPLKINSQIFSIFQIFPEWVTTPYIYLFLGFRKKLTNRKMEFWTKIF